MSQVHVDPGVCGLKTVIDCSSEDGQTVTVCIRSACPHVMAMQADLEGELDAYELVFAKFTSSAIYASADKLPHLACPVPTAIIKGIEVACGLALPKDVMFRVEK